MALEFIKLRKESDVEIYEVTERLARTEDDRVVPEDHPDARWLYAIPGHHIPLDEARKYGLVDGSAEDIEVDETTAEEPSEDAPEPESEEPTEPEVQTADDPAPEPKPKTGRRRRQKG